VGGGCRPAALEGSRPEFRPIDPLRGPTGKVKLPKRKIGRYEAADDPFNDVPECV